MTLLEKIRKTIGLSQMEMARWLNLKRPTYSLAELNQREIPTSSYRIFTEIAQNCTEIPLPDLQTLSPWLRKEKLQTMADELDYLHQATEKKLLDLQQKAQTYLTQIHVLTELLNTWENKPERTHQRQLAQEKLHNTTHYELPAISQEILEATLYVQTLEVKRRLVLGM